MSPAAPPEPVFAVLGDRALIRLQGPDWRGFLQGLLTQDVETMADGESRYAALLTPQGRVLFELFVTADGEGATLDVAAETRDALLARLKLYRLRAKVQIDPIEGELAALWNIQTAPGGGWRAYPRLAALGWRGVDLAPPPGVRDGGPDAYDRHRLALGVGDVLRDGLVDKAYALEANLDLLNGVDFRKGCFVGQETTSRMKRRSVVRSRLAPLGFEGAAPSPGAEVLAGSLRAGDVRSGAHGVALALLRLDRAAGVLSVDGRPVTLDAPAWLQPAVREAQGAAVEG